MTKKIVSYDDAATAGVRLPAAVKTEIQTYVVSGYTPGGTDVAVADGGTGASTAAAARTNLGLGTLSTLTPTGTASGTTFLNGLGAYAVPVSSPRVVTATSTATPSIDMAVTDEFRLTGLAVNITSVTLTNTSGLTLGQKFGVVIVPTATRAITWGAQFTGALLPTSAPGTTQLDVGFTWTGTQMKCIGSV